MDSLHNEHVYKYFRWKAWVLGELGKWMGQEVYEYWAEREHD